MKALGLRIATCRVRSVRGPAAAARTFAWALALATAAHSMARAQGAQPSATPETPGPAPSTAPPPREAPPPAADQDHAPAASTAPLAPTAEDYATEAGNVPPGVTPREFLFDEPMVPRNELSFMIGVPVWFRSAVDLGMSFEGRYARRLGALAPEINFGWQINWLANDELPSSFRRAHDTVDGLFLSPGLRVYVLPDAGVSPFVSAAFDLSLWHFTGDSTTVCDYYGCTDVATYDPGLGLSSRVGLAIVPTQRLQLELGARVAMALPIGPFARTQGWVTPYFGVMARL